MPLVYVSGTCGPEAPAALVSMAGGCLAATRCVRFVAARHENQCGACYCCCFHRCYDQDLSRLHPRRIPIARTTRISKADQLA